VKLKLGMVGCLVLASACSFAGPSYTITDLGTLGSTIWSNYSGALGINGNGQVVGFSSDANGNQRSFLYSDGVMSDLGNIGGVEGLWSRGAFGINDKGQVVGGGEWEEVPGGSVSYSAYLYEKGKMNSLGMLTPGANYSEASGINNKGQVVGYSQVLYADGSGGSTNHAFLWDADQGMQDLGTLPGSLDSISMASGINDNGQVVGSSNYGGSSNRAFLWKDGVMSDIGTLGGNSSSATGINNKGQIVGAAQLATNYSHAFLFSGGVMTDLGTLGGAYSVANGINDNGQVVGGSYASGGSTLRPFLYENGVMYDLNSLVVPDSSWELTRASAINRDGWIVGYALHDGQMRAFLAKPTAVPEPFTLSLGIAAVGLFLRRRMKKSQ
jgi:probable HAF family extracellular repeat protein